MKLRRLTLMIALLLLAGCGTKQQEEHLNNTAQEASTDISAKGVEETAMKSETEEKVNSLHSEITVDEDGKLHLDLLATTKIQLQSVAGQEGVTVTDTTQIKKIVESLKEFTPYSPEENYQPKYDYTITFYKADNTQLAQIKALDNFIISYEGKLFYDASEAFYLWNVRAAYIKAAKAAFTVAGTAFSLNGKSFDLKELDISINAMEENYWFGDEELLTPQVLLLGHISPHIGYGAVFDVEKMDYSFQAYGTDFAYKDYSAASLVYVFEDTIYNYQGSCLYHHTDASSYIDKLNYADDSGDLIEITLSSKEEEKSSVINRLNYYHIEDPVEDKEVRAKLLAEFQADLTHDGKEELIRISEAESDPQHTYLDVFYSDGKSRLWTETAHTAHAGWNSLYLYRKDGMDYLLLFNPYQVTDLADYSFALFYITGKNKIEIIDSGEYAFSYGAVEGSENYFEEAEFRAFADRVNTYLKNSLLLLSTEDGNLVYSTPEKQLLPSDQYETEKWLQEIKVSLH